MFYDWKLGRCWSLRFVVFSFVILFGSEMDKYLARVIISYQIMKFWRFIYMGSFCIHRQILSHNLLFIFVLAIHQKNKRRELNIFSLGDKIIVSKVFLHSFGFHLIKKRTISIPNFRRETLIGCNVEVFGRRRIVTWPWW